MSLRRALLVGCMTAAVIAVPPLSAQAQVTNVQADTSAALSLGTNAVKTANIVDITGGKTSGSNLFHSFSRFDLGAGDTARWTAGAGQGATILNIVNRVTGGGVSQISGTLDTTSFANANFYFLNPAGVVFGAGARLSIPNAVHFSTARELTFASGPAFTLTTPQGGSFSVAAPASFGFIGNRGDLRLANVPSAFGPAGGKLHLSGGNVTIASSNLSTAQVELVAMGAGDAGLSLSDPLAASATGTLSVTGSPIAGRSTPGRTASILANAGAITLNAAELRTFGTATAPAGPIMVKAGSLSMDNNTQVGTEARGVSGGGPVNIDVAGPISIIGSADLFARTAGVADAGAIQIRADALLVSGGAFIDGRNLAGSTGRAGNIDIGVAGDLTLRGSGRITASTVNAAAGGDITVSASRIFVTESARIDNSTTATASGPAGALTVTAGEIVMRSGGFFTGQVFGSGRGGTIKVRADLLDIADSNTGIIANCFGNLCTGNAGDIELDVGTLKMDANSRVVSNTFNIGNAGSVRIKANAITVANDAKINSEGSTSGDLISSGNAGSVDIQTGTLTLVNGQVLSSAFGSGAAGTVAIRADQISLTGSRAGISSSTFGRGPGGSVVVRTGGLLIEGFAFVGAQSVAGDTGSGNAGDVVINAQDITMRTGGRISSSSFFGPGRAGSINVTADTLAMSSGANIGAVTNNAGAGGSVRVTLKTGTLDDAAISTSAELGSTAPAGDIEVSAGSLALANGASIRSATSGTGAGGRIRVSGDEIRLSGASQITSRAEARSTGAAGTVELTGGTIDVRDAGSVVTSSTRGAGDAGGVTVRATELAVTGGGITADAEAGSTGNAGQVKVDSPVIRLANGGQVSSSTFGRGAAGTVQVTGGAITSDGGIIASAAERGSSGRAGNVEVSGQKLVLANAATVSSQTRGGGAAGSVRISVPDVQLLSGSLVTSRADAGSTGAAGTVAIDASSLDLSGGAAVTSSTGGSGDAGGVAIRAAAIRVADGGSVNSLAAPGSTGSAGDVLVEVSTGIMVTGGGTISSDTFGPGAAGDVTVRTPTLLVENNGQISSNSNRCPDGTCIATGAAGNVTVAVANDVQLRSGGTIATSTEGSGLGGNVGLAAGTVTIGSGGAVRSEALGSGDAGAVRLDATALDVASGGAVSTSTFGSGAAGQLAINVTDLKLSGGELSSSAGTGGGRSGNVDVTSATTVLEQGGRLLTSSASAAPAGAIVLRTRTLDVVGPGSEIASENSFAGGQVFPGTGAAGSITIIGPESLRLLDGGAVDTNSVSGPAGAIDIKMPRSGLILLSGADQSGVITTSSGPGTGGRITIRSPFAIVSDGGDILALGQQGGANVQIQSDFFIRSADRLNRLSVNGTLVVDSTVQDVSSGTTIRELNIIDASKVLRGQCATVRRSKDTSQLAVQALGPYALTPVGDAVSSGVTGACNW